jgi:hypothetical protein
MPDVVAERWRKEGLALFGAGCEHALRGCPMFDASGASSQQRMHMLGPCSIARMRAKIQVESAD